MLPQQQRFTELESFVDFVSDHENEDIQYIEGPYLNLREGLGEFFDEILDKYKKGYFKIIKI